MILFSQTLFTDMIPNTGWHAIFLFVLQQSVLVNNPLLTKKLAIPKERGDSSIIFLIDVMQVQVMISHTLYFLKAKWIYYPKRL